MHWMATRTARLNILQGLIEIILTRKTGQLYARLLLPIYTYIYIYGNISGNACPGEISCCYSFLYRGWWWRRARFTLQLVSFKRNMQARKPWMFVLLLLLLECYINDYGNEFWKRLGVGCIDLHDNCGRRQWGMRKCMPCVGEGDLIARAGLGRQAWIDPRPCWATPSRVCVCNLWRGSSPAHTHTHTYTYSCLISLCLSEQRRIINEYLYGSQSCNFLPH